MSFNYGREEKKWRLWKEAEEKKLRSLGVNEKTIESSGFMIGRCLIQTGNFTVGCKIQVHTLKK